MTDRVCSGMHACVGKHLALNELRLTLAQVIAGFEIVLGKSHDLEAYMDQYGDFVTVNTGPLMVHFKRRNV